MQPLTCNDIHTKTIKEVTPETWVKITGEPKGNTPIERYISYSKSLMMGIRKMKHPLERVPTLLVVAD